MTVKRPRTRPFDRSKNCTPWLFSFGIAAHPGRKLRLLLTSARVLGQNLAHDVGDMIGQIHAGVEIGSTLPDAWPRIAGGRREMLVRPHFGLRGQKQMPIGAKHDVHCLLPPVPSRSPNSMSPKHSSIINAPRIGLWPMKAHLISFSPVSELAIIYFITFSIASSLVIR